VAAMRLNSAALGPLIFGLTVLFVGVFVGEQWSLYERSPRVDDILHLTGGIAVAWMLHAVLKDELAPLSKPLRAAFIIGGACLVGVLWEFAEYASNFAPAWWYRYLHSGDLPDTLRDLAADILGASIAAFGALRSRPGRG
jgi:hypothetical protein